MTRPEATSADFLFHPHPPLLLLSAVGNFYFFKVNPMANTYLTQSFGSLLRPIEEHPNYSTPPIKHISPRMKSSRKRSVYTHEQIAGLEKEYRNDIYTDLERRKALGDQLALSEYQIKVWFQNKRAKEKKTTPTTLKKRRKNAKISNQNNYPNNMIVEEVSTVPGTYLNAPDFNPQIIENYPTYPPFEQANEIVNFPSQKIQIPMLQYNQQLQPSYEIMGYQQQQMVYFQPIESTQVEQPYQPIPPYYQQPQPFAPGFNQTLNGYTGQIVLDTYDEHRSSLITEADGTMIASL